MSKRQWLTVLGAWVMIFLFLGVPSAWHKIIALATGLIVIAIAYNLPADTKKENKNSASPVASSFVENEIKDQ